VSRSPHAAETSKRLSRVEILLDRAIENVIGEGHPAPCSVYAAALTEADSELRAASELLTEKRPKQGLTEARLEELDRATLLRQLGDFPARLQTLERLLAAAGEFYRGWCAAAPLQNGYEAAGGPETRGPSLLALEG
jgi:hypothetical protein